VVQSVRRRACLRRCSRTQAQGGTDGGGVDVVIT